MLNTHRRRLLLYLKAVVTFPFSQRFCATNTSDSRSFAASYLINNFDFSPQSASKLCSTYNVRFKTAEKPNSVLSFFRNRGFSNAQLHNIIAKAPWLLSCDPCKRLLPKFDFFLSRGASASDIVNLVSKHPYILSPSLKNHIIPTHELICRFLQSDKDTLGLFNRHPTLFGSSRGARIIRVLIDNGVADSNIARILRIQSRALNARESDIVKVVEELKDLGFHPSKSTFTIAFMAKTAIPKTLWNEKVDAFKKWGWSDEHVIQAFKTRPHCMLASVDKINIVMSFWVNHLGWDALALAKGPWLFGSSMEKTIIPRAAVVQLLLKKGLRKKNASLTSPFPIPEKMFVNMFIKRFREDYFDLLKLYQEKLNLAYSNTRENTGMS